MQINICIQSPMKFQESGRSGAACCRLELPLFPQHPFLGPLLETVIGQQQAQPQIQTVQVEVILSAVVNGSLGEGYEWGGGEEMDMACRSILFR